MATWFKPNCKTSCCKAPPLVESDLVTTHFTYDATTTYPTDTIPFSLLQGISQIVIGGTIPYPNTVIYMPPHTALLDLFTNPIADDQFSFDVSNTGANSIDLLIYKTNAEATGSGLDAYAQPLRYMTIPATSIVRLTLRVINATAVAGTADVKMLGEMEGGTGSITYPPMTFNLGVAAVGTQALIAQPALNTLNLFGQNIVPNVVGPEYQVVVTNGTGAQTITPYVPVGVSVGAVTQLLYPFTSGLNTSALVTASPLMVSPIAAGSQFEFSIIVSNQSAQTLQWSNAAPITGLSYEGTSSSLQAAGATYRATFVFNILGLSTTAPKWAASTLVINLNQITEPNPRLNSIFINYRPLAPGTPVIATLAAANIGYVGGPNRAVITDTITNVASSVASLTVAQGIYIVGFNMIITNASANTQLVIQWGSAGTLGVIPAQSGPNSNFTYPIAITTTNTFTGSNVLAMPTNPTGILNLFATSGSATLTVASGFFWAVRIA